MKKKKNSTLEWIAVGVTLVLFIGIAAAITWMLLLPASGGDTVAVVDQPQTNTRPATATSEPAAVPTLAPTETPAPTATPLPTYEPRFELAACPMDIPDGANVECGYLSVPEVRTQADSPEVRLAVAIIRSAAPNPKPDPIIYLEGGPGGTALYSVERWIELGYADQQDFILFDQRGTGFSEPSLNCLEIENWTYKDLGRPEWFLRNSTLQCRRRLVKDGVNLDAYNSATNAADVNDLRRVLGYEQVNLFGISYGTRLALTTMRDYPQHIRSVVLDSTYPPNVDIFAEDAANTTRAFAQLFEGCAADPECNAAYPFLEDTFYTMVAELNENPVQLRVIDLFTGTPSRVTVEGNDLIGILFLSLYDTDVIPLLPRIIAETAEGNYDLLSILFGFAFSRPYSTADGFSEGMYYSVQCNEEMSFIDYRTVINATENHPEIAEYVTDGFELERVMCNFWGAGNAHPVENEAVHSDIPTLVLAGQYDPITPPAWGGLAAETLSNSYFYEFPGFGHGVSVRGDCATNIPLAFLDNPTVAPDASCMAGIGSPDFLLPDELPGPAE